MSNYASTIASLKYLTVQINRHGSLAVVLLGTVGNLLNLLVFGDRSFHLNPCTTYLKWSSSISIIFIWSGLLTRILDGYGIGWPNQNPPLCKIRLFILMVCWSMSTWAFAGAMMDRYLCSNPLVIHRMKSTVRTARRFLIFFFILSIALFVQIFYCYEASVPNVPVACYTQTLACQMYNDWTNILYNILIPSIFMTIFSALTISNLRQRTVHPIQTNTQTQPTLRKIDRNLRKILFVQIAFLLVLSLPVGIQRFYANVTSDTVKKYTFVKTPANITASRMLQLFILSAIFLTGNCVLLTKVGNARLNGFTLMSLSNTTQEQCICEMLRLDYVSSLNYFSKNRTCLLVLLPPGVSTSVIVDINSSLFYTNQSNIGRWTTLANMTVGRCSHTTSALSNSSVLAAGGRDSNYAALLSAEIYNPVTGTWIVTGNMSIARFRHTATVLANGQVLVIGGYGNATLSSSEIYDPSTGRWAVVGNMSIARMYHTASLLLNTKVLVVGGQSESIVANNNAQIFDPSTGAWSATGSLNTGRCCHTASVLTNGKILVTGGRNGVDNLRSAELYDPLLQLWSVTGSMNFARSFHTASVLINGSVLVAGGYNDTNTFTNSAELYNPATGTWATVGAMSTARSYHTASVLTNGNVLLAGGYNNISINSAELYIASSGNWTTVESMKFRRFLHAASVLSDGKLLVTGGHNNGCQNSVEQYY
ncbi:unnamed protein product [Adineta ricciae]|uniref:G-protein coupled receptors family 1 profile domain-containing protein n=1 Tax=Adineta ricciae TaxID=249248 RepID=A0A813TBY4_ADIRI|nr:unnamed protein product [Adineta ricciae]